MADPYRTNQPPPKEPEPYTIDGFEFDYRSWWDRLLDYLFGYFCSCPDCFHRCMYKNKRPKLFSRHH